MSTLTHTLSTRRTGLWARFLEDLANRRDSLAFERVVRSAGVSEQHDLLAARRRA